MTNFDVQLKEKRTSSMKMDRTLLTTMASSVAMEIRRVSQLTGLFPWQLRQGN